MERLTYKKGEHYYTNDSCIVEVKSLSDNGADVLLDCIDKLGEYEDAEEQGLILRLPCKVGDKAYIIDHKSRVCEMEVMAIYPFGAFYEDEEKEISRIYNLFLDGNVYYKHCTFYDIGKTVFLTKEEAEQALADMKGV